MRLDWRFARMVASSVSVCRAWWRCSTVLLLAIFVSGCGQDTGGRMQVSGTVKLQGTPLRSGTIEFASADAKQLTGSMITDGKYSIPAEKGLLPGKYTVRISASQEEGAVPAGPPGPEAETHKVKDLVPPEYNGNSTLSAEVSQGGSNQFDFDLK